MSSISTDVLDSVAESLVMKKKYANKEDAVRDIALAAVRDKIAYYRRRIQKLKRKHHTDFQAFTSRLQGKATPDEEDDWFEWNSAINMLNDWKQTQRELLNERSR